MENDHENENHLFEGSFLNQSILFKCSVIQPEEKDTQSKPLRTLVYIPNDPTHPENGGGSFLFSPKKLSTVL